MELERTPFFQEVKKIIGQGPMPVHYSWTMTLFAGGKKLKPMKVVGLVLARDYTRSVGDDIVVEVMMDAGTYHQTVFPNKGDLQAILYREPIKEVNVHLDLTRDIEAQPLRATLLDSNTAIVESNRSYTPNVKETNRMDVMTIKMGLIDPALEKLRMMTFEGIYRNVTTWELMRHILTVASREVSDDENFRIRGVDIYKPDNNEKKRNIVIPNGTRFTDVPFYLHERVAGVYSAGFSYFLQRKKWWIFPTMDINRYKGSEKGLTIIKLPYERFPEADRSYRITPNYLVPKQLIVLVGENARSVDDTEFLQLNHGNGIRFADANKMFDSFGKTVNNKTVISRKENINEYLAESRLTNLNNVQRSPNHITSNTFVEASRMARRQGMFLSCTWNHSDPGAIWPGMPVKYMFMAKEQVFEAYGIVQSVEHFWRLATPGITTRRHTCSTSMMLFLGKATPWK